MRVPLLDLTRELQHIGPEVRSQWDTLLEHPQFLNGEQVQAFEREMAAFLGVAQVVGTASGTEALILGLAGGLTGIAVGAGTSYGFAEFLHWPQLLSPMAMAGSAVFSMLIGVFFGYYPAKKAAALDPIEALRSE